MDDPKTLPNIFESIETLLSELIDGAPTREAFVLNSGDAGFLSSLKHLSAAEASQISPAGGASIAAHVDHLRYGLKLLNAWSEGQNRFATADWSESWTRTEVSDSEWTTRQQDLHDEAQLWRKVLQRPLEVSPMELTGIVASVCHLAYHLGAIRQINRATKGPAEGHSKR